MANRYDLVVGYEDLTIKRLAHRMAKTLVEAGIPYRNLEQMLIDRGFRTPHSIERGIWRVFPGNLSEEAFEAAARRKEPDFKKHFWFCRENELIRHDGNTLALAKEAWDERRTAVQQMEAWRDAFPELKMSWVTRSEG